MFGCTCFSSVNTNMIKLCTQNGNVEYTGAMRTKEAMFCPVGALAMLFVTRWDLTRKEIPDFTRRESWYSPFFLLTQLPGTKCFSPSSMSTRVYVFVVTIIEFEFFVCNEYRYDMMLFEGRLPTASVSYKTTSRYIKNGMKSVGIKDSKSTHAPRRQGVKDLHSGGYVRLIISS